MNPNSELSKFQDALRTAMRENWKWFMFQGIVMLILGCLAVAEPVIASVAVDIFIGWLFLFSGLLGLVTMFSARDASAFFWMLLTAALSLAVGIMLIWKPAEGTVSLTVVLTAFFIAEGAFQIAATLSYRMPESATWTLGLIVGINLITTGMAIVMTAMEVRNDAKSLSRSAA
jgi:uncharacterized membrane protein HdeD (DUF308 family)